MLGKSKSKSSEQPKEPAKEETKPAVHHKVPCPDCDGKGINMAVSDTDLCATCNGHGTVLPK